MLLHVYQVLCALLALLVAVVVLRKKPLGLQVTGAMVIVPLLLRLFLVK